MFLHACEAVISHPQSGATLSLEAPLPPELQAFLATLDAGEARVG
jgi:23S rRNA pseudouridine955/2504/2580 synthase